MKYFLPFILIVACSAQIKKTEAEKKNLLVAESSIHSANKKIFGDVKIQEFKDDIQVTVEVQGLKPNSQLGMHIHENGVCSGKEYKTAGDHLNPNKHEHGRPETSLRHLGDLGNIVTNDAGVSRQVILIPKEKENDMQQIMGKSIIIHEKKDDLKTSPSGNSGARIACGIIHPSNPEL